jgi:acetyl-CoA synthetase
MHLLDRYLDRVEYTSYEDFREHCRVRVPERFNFAYDVVDEYARLCPTKRALVWCDDAGEERVFTFADMRLWSDRAANLLRAQGVGRGTPVMLIMKGRYEFWFLLLALHKLGAVAIPATHMLTVKDLAYRMARADIRVTVAVADDDLLAAVDEAHDASPNHETRILVGGERQGWLAYDQAVMAAPDRFEIGDDSQLPVNGDTSLLYFTSGTTGFPKMVRHDYAYPLGHILTAKYWQNVQDDGLHYTVADTGWAKAVWGKIYGQWLAGSAVFVYDYERFHARRVLANATHHGVTTFCAPPTVFRFLIKEDLSRYDFGHLAYTVTAGEPLNGEVYERWLEATGLRLMEGYGQTESVIAVATWPWLEPKPGSMGKPTPGYDMALMEPGDGPLVPTGEEGEIVIRTADGPPPGLFGGYHLDDELTRKVWHDGWYHTGDMASMDADGYLWFVGRADDVIKSAGYRIGPFEVESALMQHPAVLECAVTGIPDPERNQVVKATIVLAAGHEPAEHLKHELQQHVKAVTAAYKYPRVIEFVEALPKTISGKIRRTEIRHRDGA